MGHYSDRCLNPYRNPRNIGIQGFQAYDVFFHAMFNQVAFERRLNNSDFRKRALLDLRKLILLDTGSTVHLFMNKLLVHSIFYSDHPLYLGTNGSVNITKQKATYDNMEV